MKALNNPKNVIIIDGDETYVCDSLLETGLLKKEFVDSRIFKPEFTEDEVNDEKLDS